MIVGPLDSRPRRYLHEGVVEDFRGFLLPPSYPSIFSLFSACDFDGRSALLGECVVA